MCMCMYLCMYVGTYGSIACVCVSYVRMLAHIAVQHVYMYVLIYICGNIWEYGMCMCMYLCMYVGIWVYSMCMCMHLCMYVGTYGSVACVCVCIYVCVLAHMGVQNVYVYVLVYV